MGRKKITITQRDCIECGENYEIKKGKARKICSKCQNKKGVEYRSKNRKKVRAIQKEWRIKNRDKENKRTKEWKSKNKEKVRIKTNEYTKNKRKNDPKFRMKEAMRRMLRRCFKGIKTDRTHKMLGYTPTQLKQRIEFQFKSGMTWGNYGEWQIDHKKPISLFEIGTPPNIINCLANLQPMWKEDNNKKKNSFIG